MEFKYADMGVRKRFNFPGKFYCIIFQMKCAKKYLSKQTLLSTLLSRFSQDFAGPRKGELTFCNLNITITLA
jgi:hypothetical protein